MEALPLPITALLPVPLFPVLGILNISWLRKLRSLLKSRFFDKIQKIGSFPAQIVGAYMRETGMMFIGGISLALAIQHSGLHKRIALNMMVIIGVSPWRLLLGEEVLF